MGMRPELKVGLRLGLSGAEAGAKAGAGARVGRTLGLTRGIRVARRTASIMSSPAIIEPRWSSVAKAGSGHRSARKPVVRSK